MTTQRKRGNIHHKDTLNQGFRITSMNFQTVQSPLFFCKIIRIERLLVHVAIMVSYLLRGKEEKHSTSTILWKNRGLGTIYNQLHTIENASRVCYLKVMGVQGIMVRIHSIVVRNKKKIGPYPDQVCCLARLLQAQVAAILNH